MKNNDFPKKQQTIKMKSGNLVGRALSEVARELRFLKIISAVLALKPHHLLFPFHLLNLSERRWKVPESSNGVSKAFKLGV